MYIKSFETLPFESRKIRTDVFVSEQGFIYEFDEIDNTAIHFVLYTDDDIPVATCRIFSGNESDTFILGRLAVLRNYRGNGYGKMIVTQAEKYLKKIGGNCLMLHSQCRIKSFYEKMGYVEFGDIEYEEDCPHIWMKKTLL